MDEAQLHPRAAAAIASSPPPPPRAGRRRAARPKMPARRASRAWPVRARSPPGAAAARRPRASASAADHDRARAAVRARRQFVTVADERRRRARAAAAPSPPRSRARRTCRRSPWRSRPLTTPGASSGSATTHRARSGAIALRAVVSAAASFIHCSPSSRAARKPPSTKRPGRARRSRARAAPRPRDADVLPVEEAAARPPRARAAAASSSYQRSACGGNTAAVARRWPIAEHPTSAGAASGPAAALAERSRSSPRPTATLSACRRRGLRKVDHGRGRDTPQPGMNTVCMDGRFDSLLKVSARNQGCGRCRARALSRPLRHSRSHRAKAESRAHLTQQSMSLRDQLVENERRRLPFGSRLRRENLRRRTALRSRAPRRP